MKNTILENINQRIIETAKILKLEKPVLEKLLRPNRCKKILIPVKMDGGRVKKFKGYRCQHNDARGPYKGGIRFHPEVSETEASALAAIMTLKTALLNLPLGGAKGTVEVDVRMLSEQELEKLSRGYIRGMAGIIGPNLDIPAPDINTNAKIMGWMLDEYEKIVGCHAPGAITGKPLSLGGSEVREYATGQGALFVIDEAVKKLGIAATAGQVKKDARIGIQGFGNAGSFMAKLLEREGYKIVAISDLCATVFNYMGLEVDDVIKYRDKNGCVGGYPGGQESKTDVVEHEVDILIPAAMENTITKKNAAHIKAKLIVELANSPITPEADEILNRKNIPIVPDILANAGGVTVSYFEQVQNATNYYWTEEEVLEKLKNKMVTAFNEVWKAKKKYGVSFRTAANVVAIERVAEAMRARGLS